jgi:hypothetical protein
MKILQPHHQPAKLDIRRPEQIRAHPFDSMANKFARDLDALVRTLVHTGLLARLPQSLSEPAMLAPCLDRMRRLVSDAVWLVGQLNETGVRCQPAKNTVRSDNSRSIPVSPWKAATFKVNVRWFKFPPCTQSVRQVSTVQMNPRATFLDRC